MNQRPLKSRPFASVRPLASARPFLSSHPGQDRADRPFATVAARQ
ncbi:hypothetical protein GCM10020367_72610 [Streptomyces sannanensis]|uniref:Uncharacterized protein n=1 Tax=Streptomyces sannanensis TaxID=285536 RepID=A0ABP6SNH0_9ACTN